MGLAASQARFLGITARKNSCELKSMQIAQEKLSITNQLTQISEDYQKSLDATKLVWDSDYIIDGSIYDVSYDLLMQPSLLNDYSPQLLTNNKNQIVLDDQYANALTSITNAGYKYDENGNVVNVGFKDLQTGGATRDLDNFQKFLNALNEGGILSKANLDNMIAALNSSGGASYYRAYNGLGGDVQEKFTANSMNLATMKKYIKEITDPTSNYRNEVAEKETTTTGILRQVEDLADILNLGGHNYNIKDPTNPSTEKAVTGNFGQYITEAGYIDTHNHRFVKTFKDTTLSSSNFNMADLLEKEITLSSTDATQMEKALIAYIDNIYKIMTGFLAVSEDSVDKDYIDFAMTQVCKLAGMQWNNSSHQAGSFDVNKAYNTGDAASKHTGLIKNGETYQVSLSNLLKGALTYFEQAVEGFDSGYKVETTDEQQVTNSFYITQDPAYYYFIKNPEALDDVDSTTQLLLDYYSQMFNQICANGWTQNSLVSEPDNLKNMLKNGTLFTSTIADDGNFYQGPYTSNNFIAEVADEDAITRAEAEYKTQQLKLSAKEEELDIDLQQVDAELAALTTEYDSVKQMISKAIEKGFSTLGG